MVDILKEYESIRHTHEQMKWNRDNQWHDMELHAEDIDRCRDIIREYMDFVDAILSKPAN